MAPNYLTQPAWPGLDLYTEDSGLNPLLASYTGAPYQVRGTDPASYATNARDWWLSLGQQTAPAPDSSTNAQPTSGPGLPSWIPGAQSLNNFGIGFAGVLLALLVVGFGLLVLWKA